MSALNFSKSKSSKTPKEPKPKKEKKSKKGKNVDLNKTGQFGSDVGKSKSKKVKAPVKKVPADIYTLILFFAWLALTAACVFLYLDISSYK